MSPGLLNDLYAQMTPEERQKIGMLPQAMVKRCEANGRPCEDIFEIEIISNVENGNCFTFNANGEVGSVRVGPSSGMFIEFLLLRDLMTMTPNNVKVTVKKNSWLSFSECFFVECPRLIQNYAVTAHLSKH